ncbi:MAG: hypothetical protein AB7F88_19460 [Pyrinomonadaceae bacterium]
MMSFVRTLVLALGCISFIVVIGGAVYEHLAVVPVWASAAPASLAMFQGEYPLAAARFWIPIHPITLTLLVAALVLNWRTGRRGNILIGLAGYIIVLVITSLYFVPELMAITGSAYSPTVDAELTQRAKTWESLSLLRLGFMILMAIVLLFGLSRHADRDH